MRTRWAFRDFAELVAEIAVRKTRAARARTQGVDPAAEPARSVFLGACEEIASAFAPDGFRYAKSGPHASRGSGDLKHRIGFASSHNNVSGEYVQLKIAANVRCAALSAWRSKQRHPLPGGDFLAGGNLGGLLPQSPFLVWDLADPVYRPSVVADAIQTLRTYALPYFDKFSSIPSILALIRANEGRGLNPERALEFTLAFGSSADAVALAQRLLSESPAAQALYNEAMSQYRDRGFPSPGPRNIGDSLARLAVSNSLEF